MDSIYPFQAMGQHLQNAVAELPHQMPQTTYAGPSWEEMEAKRQEMITSFKDIAAAMTRCVAIIEDYTRLTPSSLALDNTADQFNLGTGAAQALTAPPISTKVSRKVDADGVKIKKKKEKKPKDPNAPKRPPSAYLLFQNDQREGIKSTRPDMAYKDILSEVSERWKNLTPEQKKYYDDAYNNANEEYRRADEAYKAGGGIPVAAALAAADSDSDSEDSDDVSGSNYKERPRASV
ncbi:high mobility group box domain-containing protein [Kockovaella imperatae]|uniref:High mobility group box domain-containing protein n=1 Tax=Kockovaella imperatae TaxID=4999 RepID=A0A1Y1UM39_9TREE|nr:high mobility group box domain-containing protein [Kockovaella imperatae]ORX38554.1 high mobility group box domain-containing protein [Kockovaella imperatae]